MNTSCYNNDSLSHMESARRAMLINSLPGYKPAMLVGTSDKASIDNLAIVSSHFHLGSSPPLLGMILRPTSERSERHTLQNVLASECWTLNSFSIDQAAMAHQTSAPYPKTVSEFEACQFKPERKADFQAPFVADASLQIGCILCEHLPMNINGTHILIGEVVYLEFPCFAERVDGGIDLSKLNLVTISGLDTYATPPTGIRFAPAQLDLAPRNL